MKCAICGLVTWAWKLELLGGRYVCRDRDSCRERLRALLS